jgi:hypothetical protein
MNPVHTLWLHLFQIIFISTIQLSPCLHSVTFPYVLVQDLHIHLPSIPCMLHISIFLSVLKSTLSQCQFPYHSSCCYIVYGLFWVGDCLGTVYSGIFVAFCDPVKSWQHTSPGPLSLVANMRHQPPPPSSSYSTPLFSKMRSYECTETRLPYTLHIKTLKMEEPCSVTTEAWN